MVDIVSKMPSTGISEGLQPSKVTDMSLLMTKVVKLACVHQLLA